MQSCRAQVYWPHVAIAVTAAVAAAVVVFVVSLILGLVVTADVSLSSRLLPWSSPVLPPDVVKSGLARY